jgi:hypothetical protein
MPIFFIQCSHQEGLFCLVLQHDAEQFQSNAQNQQQYARPCLWGKEHQCCTQHYYDRCNGAPGMWILYHFAFPLFFNLNVKYSLQNDVQST